LQTCWIVRRKGTGGESVTICTNTDDQELRGLAELIRDLSMMNKTTIMS